MDFSDIQKISEIDLYEVLNINQNADYKIIKKNYRKLVLKFHPDKPNGDKDAYEIINLAYSVLKNENLRSLYDDERKKYIENNQSFDSLRNQSKNIPKKNLTKEEAQQEYNNLESIYNKKHGFNIENTNSITQSEMMKRLNELNFNRSNVINETKSKMKKINLSKSDFNEMFLKDGSIDDKVSNDIIAFNDDSNMSLINYSSIDNFELYNSNGSNTTSYSSIESAFNQKLPINIKNNYSSHNSISNIDKNNQENKLKQYNEFTNKIKNMRIGDFN